MLEKQNKSKKENLVKLIVEVKNSIKLNSLMEIIP